MMEKGKQRIITLTTDFGTEDGNAAVMKGVILRVNPHALVVDLTHDIPPQDIADAAYVLRRAYTYFPRDTIHTVVVDPGVGTPRRAMAVQSSDAFFVAPDNGVLTYVIQQLQDQGHELRIVSLTNPQYWLSHISRVFHGRDIFAPVAAHLSLGVDLDAFGHELEDWVRIPRPRLEMSPDKITGQVMHVDHFGNLLTNIPQSALDSVTDRLIITVAAREIRGLTKAFGHRQAGELIAYIDSSGHLAVGLVNGSAQQMLNCQVGTPVEIRPP
jgi:S-adenosylmethionine hydrolase